VSLPKLMIYVQNLLQLIVKGAQCWSGYWEFASETKTAHISSILQFVLIQLIFKKITSEHFSETMLILQSKYNLINLKTLQLLA